MFPHYNLTDRIQELQDIIFQDADLLKILLCLHQINPSAYIAAGAIRNSVWSYLHEQSYSLEQGDIDIIYFDQYDNNHNELSIEKALKIEFQNIQWDVINQATVHTWYKTEHGNAIEPLTSIFQALSFWPETATAIAIRLNASGHLECIALFGLDDLLDLKLRRNKTLVSHQVFLQRIYSKKFLKKWPNLQHVT